MLRTVFQKPGQFFKGNIHTHSKVSDGHKTLAEVCAHYRDAGYDFLSVTDHMMQRFDYAIADTRPYRTEAFTTLIGAELHTDETEFGELWHLVAVGLPLDFSPYPEGETAAEVAQRAKDAGAFIGVAHPNRHNLTEADILSLGEHAHAIEVFNGTSLDHNDKAYSWHIFDILIARGKRYGAYAADDAHFNPAKRDDLLGWVHVKSEALDPDAILEALKAGDYYSSTGPQIHNVEIYPNDRIEVQCSPATHIFATAHGWRAVACHGENLESVSLDISWLNSPYIRISVRDENGQHAWTNVFWLD